MDTSQMWQLALINRLSNMATVYGRDSSSSAHGWWWWLEIALCLLLPCALRGVNNLTLTASSPWTAWDACKRWWKGGATREVACEWQSPHGTIQRREHQHNLVLIKALQQYVAHRIGSQLPHADICLARRHLDTRKVATRYMEESEDHHDVDHLPATTQQQGAGKRRAFDIAPLPRLNEATACEGVRMTRRERTRHQERTTTIEQRVELVGESPEELDAFIQRAYAWYLDQVRQTSEQRYMFVPYRRDDEWRHERFVLSENKTFESLFFPQKKALLRLVENFTRRQGKFAIKGFPQKLGLLLHGPPGTGKTSLIKALAHHLRRHIISIPLSRIVTNGELRDVVFRSQEYRDEDATPLGFSNVVYVLEEIDIIANVTCQRRSHLDGPDGEEEEEEEGSEKEERNRRKPHSKPIPVPDALHLGGLLEVLDGVVDCPDRVLVMTTNHPEKLDPALIRAGRFSQTLCMGTLRFPEAVSMLEYYFRETIQDAHRDELQRALGHRTRPLSPADFERLCGEHETIENLLKSIESVQ